MSIAERMPVTEPPKRHLELVKPLPVDGVEEGAGAEASLINSKLKIKNESLDLSSAVADKNGNVATIQLGNEGGSNTLSLISVEGLDVVDDDGENVLVDFFGVPTVVPKSTKYVLVGQPKDDNSEQLAVMPISNGSVTTVGRGTDENPSAFSLEDNASRSHLDIVVDADGNVSIEDHSMNGTTIEFAQDEAEVLAKRALKTGSKAVELSGEVDATVPVAVAEETADTTVDTVKEKVVAERPISSKRFHVEAVSPIEGTAPVVTSRVGKFMDKMSGKVTNIANRVEGAADIRSDTKRMVERQKIALDGMVENAKIERTATRKARNSALIHGNAIARRLGSANRSEIKQLESERLSASFKAIAEARIRKNEKRNRAPGTTSRTDGLRKFGALITNGLEVHAQVKAKAKAEMARTKTERRDARTEFKTQKDRRSSLDRGIFNSGRTLSGAVDSRIGSFSRAGEFASTNESDRIAFDKKRVEAEFKARSEAARQLAKQRTAEQSKKLRDGRKKQVDKFREERQSH